MVQSLTFEQFMSYIEVSKDSKPTENFTYNLKQDEDLDDNYIQGTSNGTQTDDDYVPSSPADKKPYDYTSQELQKAIDDGQKTLNETKKHLDELCDCSNTNFVNRKIQGKGLLCSELHVLYNQGLDSMLKTKLKKLELISASMACVLSDCSINMDEETVTHNKKKRKLGAGTTIDGGLPGAQANVNFEMQVETDNEQKALRKISMKSRYVEN